jgi:hypothetical protein
MNYFTSASGNKYNLLLNNLGVPPESLNTPKGVKNNSENLKKVIGYDFTQLLKYWSL